MWYGRACCRVVLPSANTPRRADFLAGPFVGSSSEPDPLCRLPCPETCGVPAVRRAMLDKSALSILNVVEGIWSEHLRTYCTCPQGSNQKGSTRPLMAKQEPSPMQPHAASL